MSNDKKYWVVIHYEREIKAESEWDACVEISMGNTIVENATIIAKELPDPLENSNFKDIIRSVKIEARREAAISIILNQIAYKTENYSLTWEGIFALSPEVQEKINALSLEQLEELSIDALNFATIADLEVWLERI